MKKARSKPRGKKPTKAEQDGAIIVLSRHQLAAAALVAADELTNEQIAAEVGIGRTTLDRWKHDDDFVAEVRKLIAEYDKQMLHLGMAQRRRRVEALNDRHRRMARVIEARSKDPGTAKAAGGDTGLIVRDIKSAGGKAVLIYSVDTPLLKEMRETEKQIAQEVGQWTEKLEHSAGAGIDPGSPYGLLLQLNRQPIPGHATPDGETNEPDTTS